MTQDPTRLLEDPGATALLRSDLATAGAVQVQGLDVAGGLAGLQAAIGAETGAIPALASGGAGGALVGKTLLGVALVGVIAWWGLHDPEADASASRTPATTVAAAPQPEPEPTPAPVASTKTPVAPVPTAAGEPIPEEPEPVVQQSEPAPEPVTARTKAGKPAASKSATVIDDAVVREAKQIQAARKALGSDAARALALTESIAAEFPSAQLVEEREAIAIRALAKLGRSDDAQTRATAFLAKYGRGPHAAAVRRAVQGAP